MGTQSDAARPAAEVAPTRWGPRVPARVGAVVAPALALLAACGTAAYLWPLSDGSALNLAAAVIVLALPLLGPWPLNYAGVARAATAWAVLGLVGAYIFGTLVLLAGGLTALTLVIDARLLRPRRS